MDRSLIDVAARRSARRQVANGRPAVLQMMVQPLERRLLFTVTPIANEAYDTANLPSQTEPAIIAYDPQGTNTPTVVAAYEDSAMRQFSPQDRNDGWAASIDGGNTFSRTPQLLLPQGVQLSQQTLGDDGNTVLARNNSTGTIDLATTTDVPINNTIHPAIEVFQSTDNGQTFSTPVNATAKQASNINDIFDKPWLAVDNNPGTGNGTVYLAFAYFPQSGTGGIYLTSSPDGKNWPLLDGTHSSAIQIASGNLDGPQVLVTPNHDVWVVYLNMDDHQIEAREVLPDQTLGSIISIGPVDTGNLPDIFINSGTDGNGNPIQIRGEVFPSIAYNATTQSIDIVYANLDGSGTPRAYFAELNLNNQTVSKLIDVNGSDGAGQGSVYPGEQWQPTVAVSPTGRNVMVGFYDQPDWDGTTSDGQIYVSYDIASVAQNGVYTWSSVNHIAGPMAPPAPFDPTFFPSNQNPYYLGDYDTATADFNNFYYGFSETSPETFTVNGSPVTYSQTDVYLATVPIPLNGQVSSAPVQPVGLSFSANLGSGSPSLSWTTNYSNNESMSVEYSTPTQGWKAITSTPAGNKFVSLNSNVFPYDPGTTYYFRLRAVDTSGNSSTYSNVLAVPGNTTMFASGTTANDSLILREDKDRQHIDLTLNGASQTPIPIISGGILLVRGGGGNDSITLDLSNGNFLSTNTTIDNAGGTLSLSVIGSPAADVAFLGGTSNPLTLNGISLKTTNTVVNNVSYADGGGNDAISVSSNIPISLATSTGSSTITISSSLPVTLMTAINGGGNESMTLAGGATPKLAVESFSGVVNVSRSPGTGIRQVAFSNLTIGATGKVVVAASSATAGDYSKHGNRSVLNIDAGGLTLTTGAVLDMGDNDLVLHYASANETAARNLVSGSLASGFDGGGFDTAGINSSAASYDAYFGSGTRALGWLDNNDIGATSFDGVNTSDLNEVMVKFTYYGDSDLSGTVDATDFGLFAAGKSNAGTGWAFGNYDYNATTADATDFGLFAAGNSGYKQFGRL